MTTAQNVPLQNRAGKNYAPYIGIVEKTSFDWLKFQTASLTLLEGRKDELLSLGFGFSGGVLVNNNSGGSIDVEMRLLDANNNVVLLDSSTIADAASAILTYTPSNFLDEGEKIVLVITSSNPDLSGDGVVVQNSVSQFLQASAQKNHTVVDSTTVLIEAPAGGVLLLPSIYLANFSGVTAPDITSVSAVLEDGSELLVSDQSVSVPVNSLTQVALAGLTHPQKFKIRLSALPSSGYLLLISDCFILSNKIE